MLGACRAGATFEAELAQADAPPKPERTTATKITCRSTRTPSIAGCPLKLADNNRTQIIISGPTSRKWNVAEPTAKAARCGRKVTAIVVLAGYFKG
jgi:hypothetical protein